MKCKLLNLWFLLQLKCHKYWPEERSGIYGPIRVHVQEVLILADYTTRTFSLQREGSKEERIVTQYHYTSWPDHGVPDYPTALLHFVRKVASSNPLNAGPMVAHCSAGVGRTGTFLTIFSQLRRLKAESNIDIFGYVRSMRYRRCYMVQTEVSFYLAPFLPVSIFPPHSPPLLLIPSSFPPAAPVHFPT